MNKYVVKNGGEYIETHSSRRNIKWTNDLYAAKVFGGYRHALRWGEEWEIWQVFVTPSKKFINEVERVTWVEPEPKPEPEVEKKIKISGMWDFIPRDLVSRFNNRKGYRSCTQQS